MQKEYIKRIVKQQKIEELRNHFYKKIQDHGEETAWIYAMLTLYLSDAITDDTDDINNIHTHLKQFELALEWFDTPRIHIWKNNIKFLLGERYISYQEYQDYDEENEEWVNEYEEKEEKKDIEDDEDDEDIEDEEIETFNKEFQIYFRPWISSKL